MSKRTVTETASCRIDLAGGTLDLWPLYLFFEKASVVQMAIKVKAKAEVKFKKIRSKKNSKNPIHLFSIQSHDLGVGTKYDSLEALGKSLELDTSKNPLRWINRIIHAEIKSSPRLKSGGEWTIACSSDAPPGSGLGGSSVLGVALSSALRKALGTHSRSNPWQHQMWIRDLEAQEIEHPAGEQDYVPALLGGFLVFELGANLRRAKRISNLVGKQLSSQLLLLYTGKPHHSGLNNWAIFKSFFDKEPEVRQALTSIRNISESMANLFLNPSHKKFTPQMGDEFATLLNDEWAERQKLSPAVCPPILKSAWDFGTRIGATGRKACGAGGGGCLLLYFPNPKLKQKALKTSLPDPRWKWIDPILSEALNAKKVL